jgi:nucleoside-diphosphate-sugar epimerase
MKIFITGATGYIGSAVAEAFARKGHAVYGLVRRKEKGRSLEARGVTPVLGQMKRPDSYARYAGEAQVLIHCAAEYSVDFEALDRHTVTTFLSLAKKRTGPRTIIYTSGVWLYGNTGPAAVDESAAFETAYLLPWRAATEKRVLESSGPQLRGLVVRPGCVYGGRGGLTGYWFSGAQKDAAAPILGEGTNRWAMIHVDDLAALYVRLAESNLRAELFNVTDRSRFTVLEMAAAASTAAGAGGKVRQLSPKEAEKAYGGMAKGMALDQHVDSSKAARLLGWNPRFGGFSENAERFHAAWKAAQGAQS